MSEEISLGDSEKLKRFIEVCASTSIKLRDEIQKLENETQYLGTTYHDSQYQGLRKQISIATMQINEFIESEKKTRMALESKYQDIKKYERSE